jgi:hypothetical protein
MLLVAVALLVCQDLQTLYGDDAALIQPLGERATKLRALVAEYFTAGDARRAEIVRTLTDTENADVPFAAFEAMVRRERPMPEKLSGRLKETVKSTAGEGVVHIILPTSYDPAKEWPLLLTLH